MILVTVHRRENIGEKLEQIARGILLILAKKRLFFSQDILEESHSNQENKLPEVLEDKFPTKLSNFLILRIFCLFFFKFNENK